VTASCKVLNCKCWLHTTDVEPFSGPATKHRDSAVSKTAFRCRWLLGGRKTGCGSELSAERNPQRRAETYRL